MQDPRTKKLAKLVVNYFLKVKHDSNVVISASTEAADFVTALYAEVFLLKIKKGVAAGHSQD